MIGFVDPEDFRTLGYDPDKLFEPLKAYQAKSAQTEAAAGGKKKKAKKKMNAFSWERRLLHLIRRNIHKNWFGKLLRKIRFTCDVLLR